VLRKLFVVRHGETLWNSEFRLQGRLDSPLTEQGERQAEANGELLARMGIERLLVSPLGRTQQTAAIINTQLNAQIELFDELIERDCGTWAGLTMSEIKTDQAAAWRERMANEWLHRPPGGENMPDVIARIAPLLDALREGAAGPVAIVSHGVVGKAILAHYLKLTDTAAGHIRQPNEVVYALDFTQGTPQCAHYKGGAGPLAGVVRSPQSNFDRVTGQ